MLRRFTLDLAPSHRVTPTGIDAAKLVCGVAVDFVGRSRAMTEEAGGACFCALCGTSLKSPVWIRRRGAVTDYIPVGLDCAKMIEVAYFNHRRMNAVPTGV